MKARPTSVGFLLSAIWRTMWPNPVDKGVRPVATPKKANPQTGGRPTQYKEEYVKQAYNLCLLGATTDDLARSFGVSTTTIENWMGKYPDFLGALKAGKEEADALVAKSLFKRANGHSVPETKVFNNQGEIITLEYGAQPHA